MTYEIMKYRLEEILSIIDATEYPETYSYISEVIENHLFPYSCESASSDQIICDLSIIEIVKELYFKDMVKDKLPEISEFIINVFEDEAEQGNSYAMNTLGEIYTAGEIVEQDHKKALKYYIKAYENGNRAAIENLGYVYYYGKYVEKDYAKAYHCFIRNALIGSRVSQYKIGDMYRHGYYVEKDSELALLIYYGILEEENPKQKEISFGPVYLRLGEMLLNGEGTDKDYERALEYFQISEKYLLKMVQEGKRFYIESLKKSITGQQTARENIFKTLNNK